MATGRVPTTANSPLTAKGDLFGYSTTQARVAVGSDGDFLVADSSATTGLRWQASTTAGKNRVINGAMEIDQRNSGASVSATAGGQYFLDRWTCYISAASKFSVQQNSGSVTPPVGFTKYLGVTSSTAWVVGTNDYATIQQFIEGYNVADLSWGTANAKSVTLSFLVYSSLTGTFGGVISNGSTSTAPTRSYPFTYSIASANTWTTIKITIPGDTSGTWNTTNDGGIRVCFSLASNTGYNGTANSWGGAWYNGATGQTNILATNGATWYVTGVQLEVGSAATSFARATGAFAGELAACQRYYEKSYDLATAPGTSATVGQMVVFGASVANGDSYQNVQFKVAKRNAPSVTVYSYNGTSGRSANSSGTDYGADSANVWRTRETDFIIKNNSGSSMTITNQWIYANWAASSEL